MAGLQELRLRVSLSLYLAELSGCALRRLWLRLTLRWCGLRRCGPPHSVTEVRTRPLAAPRDVNLLPTNCK
jgi:hypothetical protein